jgi:cytidylate kinase
MIVSSRIITIGRECGSGGHTIGKTVAARLGVSFYDKKLIELVAQRSGLSEEVIREQGEYAAGSLLYELATNLSYGYMSTDGGMTLPDRIYAFQSELIEELAGQEPCVIIGRCADYILRQRTDCLNVFIYAEKDDKVQRIIQRHQIDAKEAEKHIRERDKKRASHYFRYTDRNWGDMDNYDLCLNSGRLGIEKCVSMILDAAK